MNWLAVLSPLSAWLVMLALSARAAGEPRLPLAELLNRRHLLWAYALPTLFILLLQYLDLIDHLASLGLLICLLSGCGTSGAALARNSGTASGSVVALMIASAAIAIVTLPLATLTMLGGEEAATSAFIVLAALVLAQWLPFQLGLAWFRRHAASSALAGNLERMASLSVLMLIALIAWRELPRLPEHPDIAFAAAALALLLGLADQRAQVQVHRRRAHAQVLERLAQAFQQWLVQRLLDQQAARWTVLDLPAEDEHGVPLWPQ